MSPRRTSGTDPTPDANAAASTPKAPVQRRLPSDVVNPRPLNPPRTRDEAEAQYVAARDAWIAAMRRANSGRSADLATLAIKQEAYETAAAEVELWRSGVRIPIPIEPERTTGIEVVVGQELTWRKIHEHEPKKPGLLGRFRNRLGSRR
jgi:hypothetical protein